MASEHVKTVTDQSFEAEVTQSSDTVLIDFTATWCGPCKAIAPIIDDLAGAYSGRGLKVAKLDIDQSPETPARLGIRGVPTLIVFKNGLEVARQVGAAPKARIEALVAAHLSAPTAD
jgi:thioredoxin 1